MIVKIVDLQISEKTHSRKKQQGLLIALLGYNFSDALHFHSKDIVSHYSH